MWAIRRAQYAKLSLCDGLATAYISSPPAPKATAATCRRCLQTSSRRVDFRFNKTATPLPSGKTRPSTSRRLRYNSSQASISAPTEYLTDVEELQAILVESAAVKVNAYRTALNHVGELSIEAAKAKAKLLKEVAPLSDVWESYQNLRTSIIETRAHMSDPDPTLQEMFTSEHDALVSEYDKLLLDFLPKLLLPSLPAAPLATMMTITAGIGGGEAARFAEELSRMYTRYAEKMDWIVEVFSAVEGPAARGVGGNGFREITIKFSLGPRADENASCFGDLMWERGIHRVQRVPAGAAVDKMHSSTVSVSVSPIYADTADAPLVDPKDVKQEVMRSRGAGGQHVNRTESAVRLTHVPTGITVSMQDSRSQHQNRDRAWDILRARLSERRREEEEEERKAVRLSQVRGANRGDKVRTYNFPQDRVSDHRIGFNTSNIGDIMAGEGFGVMIDALKDELAERRLEALRNGEPDLVE